ncbi:MerR family transcriptional regulator [Lactobacillus selangorensis]|nr:MerR family transcriptional regulator [Lactobacillus selangorensis]
MYSIGDVAKKLNISTSALRFYDRQGLLPFEQRDAAGRRQFREQDLNLIEAIACFKEGHVPVKDIATFIQYCMEGDSSLQKRYALISKESDDLAQKIAVLQKDYDYLQYKKWYFKTAVQAGTEKIHFIKDSNFVDPQARKDFEKLYQDKQKRQNLVDF